MITLIILSINVWKLYIFNDFLITLIDEEYNSALNNVRILSRTRSWRAAPEHSIALPRVTH